MCDRQIIGHRQSNMYDPTKRRSRVVWFLCLCDDPQGDRSRRHRAHRSARPRRPVAHPLPRRVSFHSEPGSLRTSTTASSTLVQSRRSSASVAEVTVCAMPSTASSPRRSGANAAIAVGKFNTFDVDMSQTRTAVFAVNGSRSGSFSSNLTTPTGGDHGDKARTSFFPTPQASASRIHPDSEGESSRSATRVAYESDDFVESGEEAEYEENDLELGYGRESGGRHGEA